MANIWSKSFTNPTYPPETAPWGKHSPQPRRSASSGSSPRPGCRGLMADPSTGFNMIQLDLLHTALRNLWWVRSSNLLAKKPALCLHETRARTRWVYHFVVPTNKDYAHLPREGQQLDSKVIYMKSVGVATSVFWSPPPIINTSL